MSIRYYEDVKIGSTIGTLDKGRMTTAHIMRWSAAIENFHRIHYDHPFATGHDKLPGVLVNGSWKQHVLVQLVKDSLGREGWLWKLKFRYKKMDIAGDLVRASAEVLDNRVVANLGFVTLKVAILDQNDVVSTAGWAIGVLPQENGPRVPYPFVQRPEYNTVDFPEGSD